MTFTADNGCHPSYKDRRKSAEIDAKQIAADLMKGFDLDKTYAGQDGNRAVPRLLHQGRCEQKACRWPAAAAKKASVSKTPKAIDDLLEYAKLTQYKEALIKAGAGPRRDAQAYVEELTALAKRLAQIGPFGSTSARCGRDERIDRQWRQHHWRAHRRNGTDGSHRSLGKDY